MSEDSRPTIRQIIVRWSDEYNNKIPVQKEGKRIAFLELLKTIATYGYQKDDITTSVFNQIVKECVPEHYKPMSKKLEWQRITERILDGAIEEWFKTVKIATLTDEEAFQKVKVALESPESQEAESTPYGKLMDPEQMKLLPKVDVEIDEEMAALLGYDENE